ncbi:Flp pilus assembly protein CpaB [Vibrio diazotrophicus]|uniref:Flp pilus assembly protein CpaB n=1 Tax=Vibrio diazotrophicus TaxID=685 RepID=A0A2J8GWU2_VIBDI|nr:Flp pilus assembly protein CpaB [Vibrio diazotrophicus]MCZ4374111.1 Flp pilus assembly protein CpaB [Vibrio diazotrophicus]PNH79297.1 Flp pilus assembly protein CpaB [Vibrio diazotrophicus]PNH90487.1 Flp pilus assembly protein CpaB [Vibrio diazotrophicus]PNI02923.1 Flp pilus assembly protein CpaB [Vibrio diazotrophicus]
MKKLVFILLSGIVLSGMLALLWFNTEPKQKVETTIDEVVEEAVIPKVLVAKYPIQAGALIRAKDLRWESLTSDKGADLNEVFLEGFIQAADIEGSLLTRTVKANQPLIMSDLIRPDQSQYMSAMLSPGMRAVTVEMTLAGMNYDMLRPGNFVDVILTSENTHASNQGFGEVNKHATSVILQNTRLLAINGTLTHLLGGSKQQKGTEDLAGMRETLPVTFEVTPEGAQRLLLAKQLGNLSLILRGHLEQDAAPSESPKTLWDEQLSDNHHPSGKPEHSVRIFAGAEVRTQERSTTR